MSSDSDYGSASPNLVKYGDIMKLCMRIKKKKIMMIFQFLVFPIRNA